MILLTYFGLLGMLYLLLYFGNIEGEDEHEYYKRKYQRKDK